MLRQNTIRVILRFAIYIIFATICFTTLNFLEYSEYSKKYSISTESLSLSKLKLSQFRQTSWRDWDWDFWSWSTKSEGRGSGRSDGWNGYSQLSDEVTKNLFMEERGCLDTFPGFDHEVRTAVDRGPFVLKKNFDESFGPTVQGRIKDGKLYVVSAEKDLPHAYQHYRDAVLHQLYRAIITTPPNEPLPDTIFTFSVTDQPTSNTWSFSRSNDFNTTPNQWVMPHFSYWSWPFYFIQNLDVALEKIDVIESGYAEESLAMFNAEKQVITKEEGKGTEVIEKLQNPLSSFHSKIPLAVWRGTAWFNPYTQIDLRKKLLHVTKSSGNSSTWADIKPLRWNGRPGIDAENLLPIQDFCKYKYIIYTEGVTYSGRLPFHRACRSVILTTEMGFLMHGSWSLRPVWGVDLIRGEWEGKGGDYEAANDGVKNLRGKALDIDEDGKTSNPNSIPTLFPKTYHPSTANIIFLKPDWSDLESTIHYLNAHPNIAEKIASNQRDMMVGAGYLSHAEEVCYWRSLIRGWNEVVRLDESWFDDVGEVEGGMRYEVFSAIGKTSFE